MLNTSGDLEVEEDVLVKPSSLSDVLPCKFVFFLTVNKLISAVHYSLRLLEGEAGCFRGDMLGKRKNKSHVFHKICKVMVLWKSKRGQSFES